MEINDKILSKLARLFDSIPNPPNILSPCHSDCISRADYNESRKVFNRRFDFMPSLIIKVKDTQQVSKLVRFATEHNIQFTVRSGGHDHEGESVATGKILIDFSLMNNVNTGLDPMMCGACDSTETQQVGIQPGARFAKIKPALDAKNWGIAHGTCRTVAIAGYTMGGGWGPWARLHGMGCERLSGATLVLGDGSIRYLGTSAHYNSHSQSNEDRTANKVQDDKLLWAIRGGGGLSYGIVTEFFFEPFDLPKVAVSFVIKHCMFPVLGKLKAVDVIKAWEGLIESDKNPHLIGTNLKVNAIGVNGSQDVSTEAILPWQLNGHFGGTVDELKSMLDRWGQAIKDLIDKDKICSLAQKTQMKADVQTAINTYIKNHSIGIVVYDCLTSSSASVCYKLDFEAWDRDANGLTLEADCPAPHKITSRMPTTNWDDVSRGQLVCSLQSPLLQGDEKETNVSTYITLGAISGEYYATKACLPENEQINTAFPYEDRAFTIQYQAWWDQTSGDDCTLSNDEDKKGIPTRFFENRAQDWIEACRNFTINETCGAFISFKDASVPTLDYFGDNYEALIEVKLKDSRDEKCLLRSRKTIL